MAKQQEATSEAKDSLSCKSVLDSATQMWLAGLGALWFGPFIKAQDEGTKIYHLLVKESGKLQKAEEAVADVRDRAADTWDKLEEVFEERVSRVLSRLSVPTRQEVNALHEKLEALTAAMEKLSRSPVGASDGELAKTQQKPADTQMKAASGRSGHE